MIKHRFHRQLGLVNQKGVEQIKLCISGLDSVVMALLIQLESLGAATKGGEIKLLKSKEQKLNDKNHNWGIELSDKDMNWRDICIIFRNKGMNVNCGSNTDFFHINCTSPGKKTISADLYATHWTGNAVISKSPLIFENSIETSKSFIDHALQISLAASITQLILRQMGLLRKDKILDQWVTLTAQVDYNVDEALEIFDSKFGKPIVSELENGLGSLLRFRIPLEEVSESTFEGIFEHSCLDSLNLDDNWLMNISPFNLDFNEQGLLKINNYNLPEKLEKGKILILGAGGLGSWAAPLIAQGIEPSGLELDIIDSDLFVESHNLNRQVLYSEEDIGFPKAPVAAGKIRKIAQGFKSINGIVGKLEEHHVSQSDEKIDVEMSSLAELIGEDKIIEETQLLSALNNMDIALSCLDNQFARTLLNKKCIELNVPMINGGGESFNGIVEVLKDGICMTCRYGKDAANEKEIISCQEAGTRPVPSIVSTTAWVGSNQAIFALLELYLKQNNEINLNYSNGLNWDSGDISPRQTSRLPWFEINEECSSHA